VLYVPLNRLLVVMLVILNQVLMIVLLTLQRFE
jgi:hypothetical protein